MNVGFGQIILHIFYMIVHFTSCWRRFSCKFTGVSDNGETPLRSQKPEVVAGVADDEKHYPVLYNVHTALSFTVDEARPNASKGNQHNEAEFMNVQFP